jgi:hypothetical protein
MARGIVISCTLLGDWQSLQTISPNKCLKLFFFFPPLLLASRLLLWRLLLHALMQASMGLETDSTAYALQMAAALMLMALQPPTKRSLSAHACE